MANTQGQSKALTSAGSRNARVGGRLPVRRVEPQLHQLGQAEHHQQHQALLPDGEHPQALVQRQQQEHDQGQDQGVLPQERAIEHVDHQAEAARQ